MTQADAPKHLFARMLDGVHAAIRDLGAAGDLPAGLDVARVVVEPPRDPTHGDMATNAAMALAKEAGRKPRELAELIATALRKNPLVAEVAIAGPGFINLTLHRDAWLEELRTALRAGTDYGRSAVGQGEKINVEYVS